MVVGDIVSVVLAAAAASVEVVGVEGAVAIHGVPSALLAAELIVLLFMLRVDPVLRVMW